ncbi:17217_t:CDS:2, partial [Racocetra persica]
IDQNMSTKHKSYMVKQKLEIISKAKETSNKAAIQIFSVDYSQAMKKTGSHVFLQSWLIELNFPHSNFQKQKTSLSIPHSIETKSEEQIVILVDDEENYPIVYIENLLEY